MKIMSKKEELEAEIDQKYKESMADGCLTKVSVEIAIEVYKKIAAAMSRYKELLRDPELGQTYAKKLEQDIILLLANESDLNYYEGMMAASAKLMKEVMNIPQVKKLNDQLDAKLNSDPAVKAALKNVLDSFGSNADGASDAFSAFTGPRSKKENLN